MINLATAWVKATKPSVDGFRRLSTRADIQAAPGACLWIALIVVVVRSGGG
jgi:hypothetical protein